MKRTRFGSALAALAAAVGLAFASACTPGGIGSDSDAGSTEGERTGKELVLYLSAGRDYKAYTDVIAAFEKENDVKVTMQQYQWDELQNKLTADFLSGDVPDLTEEPGGFWSTRFGADGNVMALDTYIEKEDGFLDDFVQSGLDLRQEDGKTYAIPLHVTMGGLVFANQEMLDRAGVAMPTTWDEFKAAAKAIQESGVTWGAALNNDYSYGTPWTLQGGAAYTNSDTPLRPVDAAARALTFQRSLVDEKIAPVPVASSDYAGPRKLFTSGEAGLIISGPWDISAVEKEAPDFPLSVGLPLKDKETVTTIAGSGLMIPAKSQNPDLAWKLIKALTTPEVQEAVTKETGMAMSRKSWAESDFVKQNPILSTVAEARNIAVVSNREYWSSPNIAKIQTADKEMYENVVLNGADPKQEVERFNETVKGLLGKK